MGNGILVEIVNQNVVADAAVEATDDEGVDFAEGFDSGDGRFWNRGDAVVIKLNPVEGAHQLYTVLQAFEGGQMCKNFLVADVKLFDSQDGGHDVVVVVSARKVVVTVQIVFT